MNDADRYRWLVNHAGSFDGSADSDNMVRLWFYRPDGREVMVQGKDLDAAISAADAERRAILALRAPNVRAKRADTAPATPE